MEKITKERFNNAMMIAMNYLFGRPWDEIQETYLSSPLPYGNCRCVLGGDESVYNPEFMKFWEEISEKEGA